MEVKEFLDHLSDRILELGIDSGDAVYLASDATGLLFRGARLCGLRSEEQQKMLLHSLLDKLREILGTEGTLLIPVYFWGFCRGEDFDIRSTQGQVGSLGNYALANHPSFQRTAHPIYSFMVSGRGAEALVSMRNVDSWGKDSPFGWLHQNKGKLLMLDVGPEDCNTFEHYVEQCIGVPYRYHKEFRGGYIDREGERTDRTYRMYVRDLKIDFKPSKTNHEFYRKHDLMEETSWEGIRLSCIRLSDSFPVIADDLLNHNAENLYEFDRYRIDWTVARTHEDDPLEGRSERMAEGNA